MLQRAVSGAAKPAARAFSSIPPFHIAVPVHDLEQAKAFYGGVLGCSEGRSSAQWQDYNLFGHQLVVHQVSKDYRGVDFFNPVGASALRC
jgi:extradiol dioxygenase family protein